MRTVPGPYPVQRFAPAPVGAPEPTLRDLASAVLRHRLLLLVCMALAVGLGAAYTLRSQPMYQATSVVRFEVDRVDLPQLVQSVATLNLISTELEVLGGRSAAMAVIDSLGLRARLLAPRRGRRAELFAVLRVLPSAESGTLVFSDRGDDGFAIRRPDSARIIGSVRVGDTATVAGVLLALNPAARGLPELRLRIDLPDDAVGRLRSGLKVSRPARDADLISIRIRASDPAEAAATANLLASNVISGRQAFRKGRTAAATVFLQKQADTLRGQLRAAEDSLRAYREREHVVDAPEQARSQVARLAGLQANLAVIRADRDAFAKLIAQLRQEAAGQTAGGQSPLRRFMAFPSLLQNQSASVLLGALAQVETQRADMLIRRTPADVDVQALTGRVREIEAQLQGIAESFHQGLANQVAALEDEASRFGAQLDALPLKELQSARRERDARMLNELWVLVQTRLKESEITGSVGDPTVRLVDAAVPPLRPVSPSLRINLALSLVLGTMIGVMLSLARDYGDRSVRSRADAVAAAGLPVLGAIPRMSRRGLPAPPWRWLQPGKGIASLLVTQPGTPVAYVESFNQLFANLALAYRERPRRVVVFTSPLPGEGKTLSAINFALVGASQGLRMLLIDADLRCGVVSAVFGCARAPGFAELLAGTAHVADLLHPVSVGEQVSLMAMPSGMLPKVPGRVLNVERVHEVLGALAPQFDFVVIDTPPVNLLADAAVLASAADAVLLVVRAGHTRSDALRYAMNQLEAVGAPVFGTLLNDIDLRRNAGDDGSYRYLLEAGRYHVSAG